MKKIIIITVTVISLFLFKGINTTVKAQFDAMFTQYMFNEMFINPAYTGYKEGLSVTALHRQQWVDFDGRPITTTVSIHSPVYQESMGLGLSYLNEKIGVLNRNLLYASYAYRAKVSEKGRLCFGIMGGIHVQNEKLGELAINDPDDPHFTANTKNIVTPNFGFGMLYHTDKFYVGLSIPRLIDDNVTMGSYGKVIKTIKFRPKMFHYYLTVGNAFVINEAFTLKPQLMLKAVINAPIEFDINLNALIKQRLWIGASYRSGADISGIIGVYVIPQLLVSYSYDYSLSKINKVSSGSHEVALSYLFYYKNHRIANPRYF
ncbi:MAG TPA: type IX secretion system membrane protein PorP/SprF [Bacteroidales bacterium]|nr:type IX secretion system membrane protein PorP/SprF [Bacteroidales bacterium]